MRKIKLRQTIHILNRVKKSYRYDTIETYGWTGGVREKVGYKNDPSAKVKKLKVKHRLSNASYTIITLIYKIIFG